MAKRKAARRATPAKRAKKHAAPKRTMKRPLKRGPAKRKSRPAAKRAIRRPVAKARSARRTAASSRRSTKTAAKRRASSTRKTARPNSAPKKAPRLDRVRRTLEETVPTPPSSLDMERHGSAVRTGRAEMAGELLDHSGMSPSITAGDVDVDVEDAYFTGDEAPGGDNSTPDQDVVDDIGKALGVQYDDNEELKASDKITERDRHRWEMDPASSEDYKDRK